MFGNNTNISTEEKSTTVGKAIKNLIILASFGLSIEKSNKNITIFLHKSNDFITFALNIYLKYLIVL